MSVYVTPQHFHTPQNAEVNTKSQGVFCCVMQPPKLLRLLILGCDTDQVQKIPKLFSDATKIVFVVFPKNQSLKSGALIIRDSPPHYMYYIKEMWFGSTIHIATSNDLMNWTQLPYDLFGGRPGMFDSHLVESGPPPLKLSSGDYFFLYNGHEDSYTYLPGWVCSLFFFSLSVVDFLFLLQAVINKDNLTEIVSVFFEQNSQVVFFYVSDRQR